MRHAVRRADRLDDRRACRDQKLARFHAQTLHGPRHEREVHPTQPTARPRESLQRRGDDFARGDGGREGRVAGDEGVDGRRAVELRQAIEHVLAAAQADQPVVRQQNTS